MDLNKKLKKFLYKIEKEIKDLKFECLHEGCSGDAQKSHSQQKNGPLLAISNKKNEVYALDSNLARSFDIETGKRSINFKKKQISSVSVFPGFCVKHEAMFSVFEKDGIEKNNDKQACYLSYRTFGYERSRKRDWMLRSEKLGCVKSKPDLSYKIEKELIPLMQSLLSFIEEDKYDDIETIWHVIPRNLKVSCSSCISLYNGTAEQFYQKKNGEIFPIFTFDVIPSKSETMIVITWLKQFDKYSTWLKKSMNDPEQLEKLINRFIFFDSEDICINPAIWKDNKDIQQAVTQMSHVMNPSEIKTMDIPILISIR